MKLLNKYLIIVLLFSCKSSEQLYNKAKSKDLVKVAEMTRKDFPCTTTSVDTIMTVDTIYDYINVECPVSRIDSFETVIVNTVKVRVPREVITINTVERVEDSAKITTIYAQMQKAELMIFEERKTSASYKADAEKNRKSKNWWRKWCLITWGIIASGIAFKLFKSKLGL